MRIPSWKIPISACLALSALLFAEPATPLPKPTKPTAAPVGGPSAADTIDRKKVHAEYGDGNFETVVQILEDYRARHNAYRSTDSVFIAKYLGVIYASNPDSREKGKYWLYKMLQIDPASSLVDLYVGEAVEHTYEKVRQEFIVRRNYQGINDTRLAKAVEDAPPKRQDTVVLKDTVVVKNDTWISPITDGTKFAYSEVKGGIKAGIESGYVPIKEETVKDDSRWTGNINIGGGLKFLDKEEWEELAGITDQTEIRVATDIRQRRWPINIALDASYAFAPEVLQVMTHNGVQDTATQSVVTYEVNVGVRKIFDFRLYSVRPFFGGGFSRITTQWDLEFGDGTDSYRDGKLGLWFNGGVYWELDRHFNIGLEYLFSNATIDLFGKRNHGGHHLDMIAGFHF